MHDNHTHQQITASLSLQSHIHVAHINMNRISTHFSDIKVENNSRTFDILALTKTFLTPEFPTHIYNIPGYVLTNHDRIGKSGGGVGFYHRDHYIVETFATSLSQYSDDPELIITTIIKKFILLFCVVYWLAGAFSLNNFFKILS